MKKLLYLFLFLLPIVGFSQFTKIVDISGMIQPGGTGSISTSLNSITLATTQGTASNTTSFTISGTGLTTTGAVVCPTYGEISLDQISWLGTINLPVSTGVFTGQPVTMWARIKSTTAIGTYNLPITVASAGASTKNVTFNATVTAFVAKDSIRVQLDTTAAFNQAGWTVLLGDPNKNVKSATAGNNGTLTVTSVAADVFHWAPFGVSCTGSNTGLVSPVMPNYALNVMKECWFNGNSSYTVAYPQLQFGGLNPASTYTVSLFVGFNCSFSSLTTTGEYRVSGATLMPLQTLTGVCNSATTPLTFGPVAPDGSGIIKIYFNPVSGQQTAGLNAVIIKEN